MKHFPTSKVTDAKIQKRLLFHSVEISGFFCHSDLRETNFEEFGSCKTAFFAILGAQNLVDLINFSLHKVQKFIKIKITKFANVRALKLQKKTHLVFKFHVRSE